MTGNNFHHSAMNNRAGVTLMESVTVIAVFSLTVLVITGLLINSFTFQRKINAQQRVLGDSRDALEAISREIRLDQIDYYAHIVTASDDLALPQDHLYLVSGGKSITLRMSSSDLGLEDGVILVDERPLSSEELDITSLQFIIRPTTDPYLFATCSVDADCAIQPGTGVCTDAGLCEVIDQHPTVTILLSAQNRNTDPEKRHAVQLQTTVSSRVYKR